MGTAAERTLYPTDPEHKKPGYSFNPAGIIGMLGKTAVVSTGTYKGGKLQIRNCFIIIFLRNSIAIRCKNGYHIFVIHGICYVWLQAGNKLWSV